MWAANGNYRLPSRLQGRLCFKSTNIKDTCSEKRSTTIDSFASPPPVKLWTKTLKKKKNISVSRCQRLQFPWEGFKCGSYCIAFIRFCYETEWLTLWSQSVLSLGQQVYSKLNGMIEQSWHIVHRREPLKGAFDRTRSGRLGQSITRLVTERVVTFSTRCEQCK